MVPTGASTRPERIGLEIAGKPEGADWRTTSLVFINSSVNHVKRSKERHGDPEDAMVVMVKERMKAPTWSFDQQTRTNFA
jgi:hypothetical protein